VQTLAGSNPLRGSTPDPEQIFRHGEKHRVAETLISGAQFQTGRDPQSSGGGAYANLGVTYMRRKQWTPALANLHKAEKLAPKVQAFVEYRVDPLSSERLSTRYSAF